VIPGGERPPVALVGDGLAVPGLEALKPILDRLVYGPVRARRPTMVSRIDLSQELTELLPGLLSRSGSAHMDSSTGLATPPGDRIDASVTSAPVDTPSTILALLDVAPHDATRSAPVPQMRPRFTA
jgi:hypothetical protein